MITVQSLIPHFSGYATALDWAGLVHLAVTLGIGLFVLGGTLRLIFGKGSAVVKAVSASIHVILIYVIAALLYALAPLLRTMIPPMPFVSISGDACSVWDISSLPAEVLFPGLLRLFVLGFLVNLLEDFIPLGSKFLHWIFFRLITAGGALGLYFIISALAERYAPQIFSQWAGPILISLWLLIGILGLSKGLLTLIAAVFNPLLGLLFTFFFTSRFGKQFTKSIATCLLTAAVFYVVYQAGLTGFAFFQFSAMAYGPPCFVVLMVLYLFRTFI